MSDVLVFVPAWNEEASLPAVLDELAHDLPGADVFVVDDGSTDATATVARERGAEVESFPENRGLQSRHRGRVCLRPRGRATPSAGGSTPTASIRWRSFAA